ncbi:MAG: hypothetical protein JXR11_09495 [Balneola sp.]
MENINSKLSSSDLAELISNALYTSGLITKDDFDKCMKITEDEINARKGVKDYCCSACPNLD